ncbi:MAG: hypothetical protein IJY60_02780, partial [Bacteroides sp.]|nr:hypothetical protein [Bacteroides sp.]
PATTSQSTVCKLGTVFARELVRTNNEEYNITSLIVITGSGVAKRCFLLKRNNNKKINNYDSN